MKIYILRHGTTVWNETGRTQGRRQNQLSKTGKELASEAAEKLKREKIEIIYSSPLMRTMQTTNIVNQFHNVTVIRHPLLTEIDQGVFSGRFWKSLSPEEKKHRLERDPEYGLESYEHAYQRVKEFVETVLKHETHKNVLVVSHNNICSFMELILTGQKVNFDDHDQINSFDNAEYKVFEL